MSGAGFRMERFSRTAVLTFDRPPAHVLDATSLRELATQLDALEADRDISTLVITGAGERFFCAGDDLNMYDGISPAVARELTCLLVAVVTRLHDFSGLTLAAINGWCLGAGLECALACDIRIAERHARLGLPEGRVGLLPCGGGTATLARQIGRGWAKRLILCGETVDVETAERIGLVEQSVAGGESLPAALALAEQAARQSPTALAASKRLIDASQGAALTTALASERAAFGTLFETADAAEGVAAFLGKREPVWTHDRSRNR